MGCTCDLCGWTAEVTMITWFSVFVMLLEASPNILRDGMLTDRVPMEMDVVPCSGIFIMTSAVFLSFLSCPLPAAAKSLSRFFRRYQF